MRKAGLAGLMHKQKVDTAKKELGSQLDSAHKANMREQIASFQRRLESYLAQHKTQINRDPSLRTQFYQMCREMGIDPLACEQ